MLSHRIHSPENLQSPFAEKIDLQYFAERDSSLKKLVKIHDILRDSNKVIKRD